MPSRKELDTLANISTELVALYQLHTHSRGVQSTNTLDEMMLLQDKIFEMSRHFSLDGKQLCKEEIMSIVRSHTRNLSTQLAYA